MLVAGSPMTPVASPANGSASPVPPEPIVTPTQQQQQLPQQQQLQQQQNCNVMSNLVKKDLVVRFTEFQNSVQHVTSATTSVTRSQERGMASAGGPEILVCRRSSVDGSGQSNYDENFDEEMQQRYHEGKIL